MQTHELLSELGVYHGFFGRRGGVSAGYYESLNCGFGSQDDSTRVAENRRRAAKKLGLPDAPLMTVHQVHSDKVVIADTLWDSDKTVEADALVTRRRNIIIAVLTADCAPVLLYEPEAAIIGAAHAGWRGAKSGVLQNTVHAIEDLGGKRDRIRAVIGPTIAQASYEVSGEFYDAFIRDEPASDRFFKEGTRPGHPLFDLPGFCAEALKNAGITEVTGLGIDTMANPEQYFSFRNAQRMGASDYGRNISMIAMPEV